MFLNDILCMFKQARNETVTAMGIMANEILARAEPDACACEDACRSG